MIYQVFGLELVSEFNFSVDFLPKPNALGSDSISSRVLFSCQQLPPFPINWEEGTLIYSWRPSTGGTGQSNELYHFESCDVIRFAWGADFYVSPDRIDCHLINSDQQNYVELHLMAAILPFWLERQGIPTLHASAITFGDNATAFLSHSGNGKSTLAAGFIQSGAALLTDDILPIEYLAGKFWGRPGRPQINLWPDQAVYFLAKNIMEFGEIVTGGPKKYVPVEKFNNGMFCREKRPLERIYIPRITHQISDGSDIQLLPVSPAEALVELIRYSFITPVTAEKLGWQKRRLEFFACLVKLVPVRRLYYPSGFEHLPRVIDAVRKDLHDLSLEP
jgi:hypothetical protein